MNLIIGLLVLIFSMNAHSETVITDFSKYSVPVQNIICKELDFSSYHQVENVKANMIRSNPDRIHPNFAGKYLLLKNEFLFDTVWFVADCSTGKFIKDSLSTDHKNPMGKFHPDSNLLIIDSEKPDTKTPPEFHLFQNEKWMKVDPSAAATPSPSAVLINPEHDNDVACKELDFNSSSRAQNAKKNLLLNTPDRTHANFFNHYLLLKGDTIFQTYWLIADCNTGNFFSDFITGNIEFTKKSRTVKIFSSGNIPTFSMWLEEVQQWLPLQGKSKLYGKYAKSLFESFPNPKKSSLLHFDNLKWKIEDTDITIKSGKCSDENKKYLCDIEI